MVKRLMAKVGTYEKDGQTKGRYVEVGVIMENQNGEYALFDPSVNLAGVLMQQHAMAQQTGGRSGDRVMVSIFDNNRDNRGGGQSGGQQSQRQAPRELDDEVPF